MTSKVSTIVNGTVYTMKISRDPEGKIYTIDRQTAKTYNVTIPAVYMGHMVLVVGRDPGQPCLVRIVTVRFQIQGFRPLLTLDTDHIERRSKCGLETLSSHLSIEEEPENGNPASSAELC